MAELAAGDSAPDFALAADGGRTLRLGDYAGRKLVLYFYPKDDTPGCTAQLCAIRDDFSILAQADVVPFGINADGVAEHHGDLPRGVVGGARAGGSH